MNTEMNSTDRVAGLDADPAKEVDEGRDADLVVLDLARPRVREGERAAAL